MLNQVGHQIICILPGCKHPSQKTAGNGYSARYCKHHVEHHRRHGSYWHNSLTATELAPFRTAARHWLKRHHDDLRVRTATASIDGLLHGAGRAENAYHIRGKLPEARARYALARLRQAEVDPKTILERAIAVTACCKAKGIDERQREFRRVQIAKSVHRLASGTHRTTSGFPIPSKYPRSEGQILRHMGLWIDDLAALALDDRNIMEGRSIE